MSFGFKQFFIDDSHCAMKVGTDGVLLGAWADVDRATHVLDVGAGSGLLSLMVAQRSERAMVTALEVDADAAADCAANFKLSPWPERLSVICSDFAHFTPDKRYDLIISNPPFFTEDTHSPDQHRGLARHGAALSPRTLVAFAGTHLAEDGTLAMVTAADAEEDVRLEAELAGLTVQRLAHVHTNMRKPAKRLLWQIDRRAKGSTSVETVAIRDDHNSWTQWYTTLTAPFYLKIPN